MVRNLETSTSFRLTKEDREILERLQKLTGQNATGAIRLAIREAVASRVGKPRK
jgi:predicted DNA-binding protein